MRNTFTGLGAVVGVIVLIAVLVAAGWTVKYYTADIRGRINANEQIKDGSNRIAQYNYFFNQCAAVQSFEAAIDEAYNAVDRNTDPDDAARLNTNVSGNVVSRQRTINEYNARASASYTSGQFRSSNLPYQIDNSEYKRGTHTSCES